MFFSIFLVKKNYKKIKSLKWTPDSLKELRNYEIKKRSEQNYKVILKRFFKKLVKNFNHVNKIDLKNDFEFYKVNFSKYAEKDNEDWKCLRYCTVFNENHKKSFKTNQRKSKKLFAKILKQNIKFMQNLEDYLENKLVLQNKKIGIHLDYTPILKKKVDNLIEKWKDKLYSNKNLKARLCKFVLDQIKNNKIKLPWGYTEINQGILNVRKLFKNA